MMRIRQKACLEPLRLCIASRCLSLHSQRRFETTKANPRQTRPLASGQTDTAPVWTSLKERLASQTTASGNETISPEAEAAMLYQALVEEAGEDVHKIASEKATTKKKSRGSKASTTKKTPPSTKKTPPPTKKPTKTSTKKSTTPMPETIVKTFQPRSMELIPIEEGEIEVPKLAYNLERVLFNEGVHSLQDTRSKVFNFDPYLASIMPVDQFDFNALKEYITSSKDHRLRGMAKKHGKKYCGSTSSLTNILSHFHYLLSAWRMPNYSALSSDFEVEFRDYTQLSRAPSAAYARLNDGVYAIDADKEYDKESVLSRLGKSMEKLLTLPKEDFEKYRHTRSHQITEEERNADEAFHYTTFEDFMMRSQIDAGDSRLPGTGVFDLKTRAVVTIRMDVAGYEKGQGYEIRQRRGNWESFEREYCDMIRAAFLKYSLQVRMGRMDGIFVAYHNTQRIFGFQYISLDEMDKALHGTTDTGLGDTEFKASITMLNDLMDRASKRFPGRSLRLHVETRPTKVPLTYFFVEPVTDEDIKTSEKSSQAAATRMAEKIQRITQAQARSGMAGSAAEADLAATAAESAQQSIAEPTDANVASEATDEAASANQSPKYKGKHELFAMYVTVRNKVGGKVVDRPNDGDWASWDVEYNITELPESQSYEIYRKIKERRRRVFSEDAEVKDRRWYWAFQGKLHEFSQKGEKFRASENHMQQGKPVYTSWGDKPLSPEEAFNYNPNDHGANEIVEDQQTWEAELESEATLAEKEARSGSRS